MSAATRYLVTLSEEAISRPQGTQKVLDRLHDLVDKSGEVFDTAQDDLDLIEALGTVVVEAPDTLVGKLMGVPGVERVDEDSHRSAAVHG